MPRKPFTAPPPPPAEPAPEARGPCPVCGEYRQRGWKCTYRGDACRHVI